MRSAKDRVQTNISSGGLVVIARSRASNRLMRLLLLTRPASACKSLGRVMAAFNLGQPLLNFSGFQTGFQDLQDLREPISLDGFNLFASGEAIKTADFNANHADRR